MAATSGVGNAAKFQSCIPEQAPSQGSEGPKKKPNIDGGPKTKPSPADGTDHLEQGRSAQRGGGTLQRLHPNADGSSSNSPGKPGLKPPAPHGEGGVSIGKPPAIVKPCPPATIEI